jgi:hypothetical protein
MLLKDLLETTQQPVSPVNIQQNPFRAGVGYTTSSMMVDSGLPGGRISRQSDQDIQDLLNILYAENLN